MEEEEARKVFTFDPYYDVDPIDDPSREMEEEDWPGVREAHQKLVAEIQKKQHEAVEAEEAAKSFKEVFGMYPEMICKVCGKDYEVNPAYYAMIANLRAQYDGVIGHHFTTCIECLKEDDDYLRYCSSFFRRTGIDICVY